MKRLFNLQKFAAPDNMTGKAQIQTKAREIDFVSSFSDSLQALLDIMGITRMIKRQMEVHLRKKQQQEYYRMETLLKVMKSLYRSLLSKRKHSIQLLLKNGENLHLLKQLLNMDMIMLLL